MSTPETSSREPCPDRILDSVGLAFSVGIVGGSAFHFLKGIYNSPTGSRLIGARDAVRMNAPRIGGSFAMWNGLFSTLDCAMVHARQKEDPWNSIIAGAAASGFIQMRQGLRHVAGGAVYGGVLLTLIEGAGIMVNQPRVETKGWFDGKKAKEKSKVNESNDEVLESFDSRVPPTF